MYVHLARSTPSKRGFSRLFNLIVRNDFLSLSLSLSVCVCVCSFPFVGSLHLFSFRILTLCLLPSCSIDKDMLPFYLQLCDELKWAQDTQLVDSMRAAIDEQTRLLDESLKDATAHLGESEVREAMQKKADFYARIGDKVPRRHRRHRRHRFPVGLQ